MKKFGILALCFVLSACVHNYLYTAQATLNYPEGETKNAVLYWRADEGKLWFGGSAEGQDSDVDVRVCGSASTLSFLPNTDSGQLELLAASGDILIGGYDQDLNIISISEPVRAEPGKTVCGHLLVDDRFAIMEDLTEGRSTKITVLCKNARRPDRYAISQSYNFSAVKKLDGKSPDPSACEE